MKTRFGIKRGLTKKESARAANRAEQAERIRDLEKAKEEIARLTGVIEGKDEQIGLLKELLEK